MTRGRPATPSGCRAGVNNQYGLFGFAQMPGRIIINAFNHGWREGWMDGRKAPQNIGREGMDETTWMDRRGYPHSIDAKVIERYTRTDFDHLSMTETVDDPAYYTQNPSGRPIASM